MVVWDIERLFHDCPEWVQAQNGDGTFRCSVPVENLELLLERDKAISFIVIHTYPDTKPHRATRPDRKSSERRPSRLSAHNPTESIQVVNLDLFDALEDVLSRNRKECHSIIQMLRDIGELDAPYKFVFHLRTQLLNLEAIIEDAANRHQMQFLLDYVLQRYGDEYAAADAMISRGRITEACLIHLYKRGDVLVKRDGNQYRAFIATGDLQKPRWSFLGNDEDDEHQVTGTGKVSWWLAKKAMRTTTEWKVRVWSWTFDGQFKRKTETLVFSLPEGTAHTQHLHPNTVGGIGQVDEYEISSLAVSPVQFLPADSLAGLRKRGQTFWKCRTRLYISYLEYEKDNATQVCKLSYIFPS